jgi:hypothetical protein
MKKLSFLLIITTLCILASCSKDDGFNSGRVSPSGFENGIVQNCSDYGPLFMVPLPTGGDDTENLLSAIALAQAAGPGSVVQLQKGTYRIGFVEIDEFFGTIKGMDKGKTIISPVSNLPCVEELAKTTCIALVSFIGGEIRLENLSFKIDDGMLCSTTDGYGGDLYILVKFTDRYHDYYIPEKLYVKADIENVEFTGGLDDSGTDPKFNILACIWGGYDYGYVYGTEERANVDLTVSGCSFRNFDAPVDYAGIGNGKIIVKNNYFSHTDLPCAFFDMINTTGQIVNNIFTDSYFFDILIDNTDYSVYGIYPYHPPVKLTTFKISGNYFKTRKLEEGDFIYPKGTSMYLLDNRRTMRPEENVPMKFIVENNRIDLGVGTTGIIGLNNVDAMILANKFSGGGVVGISLNGTSADLMASNLKILGNNFMESDLETDVLLGEFTTNCLVTKNRRDNVVNLGINNRITGMPK